jgi:hypothetical protein
MVYFNPDQQPSLSPDEACKARADQREIHCNEVVALRQAHRVALAQFRDSPSPELAAYLRGLRWEVTELIRERAADGSAALAVGARDRGRDIERYDEDDGMSS